MTVRVMRQNYLGKAPAATRAQPAGSRILDAAQSLGKFISGPGRIQLAQRAGDIVVSRPRSVTGTQNLVLCETRRRRWPTPGDAGVVRLGLSNSHGSGSRVRLSLSHPISRTGPIWLGSGRMLPVGARSLSPGPRRRCSGARRARATCTYDRIECRVTQAGTQAVTVQPL